MGIISLVFVIFVVYKLFIFYLNYFKDGGILKSLKKTFTINSTREWLLFPSVLGGFVFISIVLALVSAILNLLNFTGNSLTTDIISFISFLVLLILLAWLRVFTYKVMDWINKVKK